MKFRIKKEDGLYLAEYKKKFFWLYVRGSVSRNIEGTRAVCKQFAETYERNRIVETFEL